MADDYIKREAAYDTLTEYYHHSTDTQHGALREALSRVPAADVRPVVFCKDCQHLECFIDGRLECRALVDLRPIPCTYVTVKETDSALTESEYMD